MRIKILLLIGAVVLLGAVLAAAAVAKNTDNNKSDPEDHECAPEMMEAGNMSQSCPAGMMDSGDCEKMGAGMEGCSSMMEDAPEGHMSDPDHCGNMVDDAASMMGSIKTAAA